MKKFISLVLALVLMLSLAACANNGAKGPGGKEEGPSYKLAVIVHDSGNSFVSEFKRGALAAAEALGITVDVLGPDAQVIEKQVVIVENAITAGYDGIACICGDATAFQSAKDTCDQKGIPFITFNMDDGKYGAGYAGAEEYSLAYAFADYFFGEVAAGEKDYIIATADSALPVCVTRANAIKDAAKVHGFNLVTTVDLGYDFSQGTGVVENTLTAYPDCKVYVGTDHFSQSIATAIESQDLNDKTFVGCFDLLEQTIQYLQSGACDLIVGQNPYLQSYYAVVMLYNYLEDGICPVNINTGAELVTSDMADATMEKYFPTK
ncbi:MAG: sugar ABC transporter substrate-binding protein [Lachnospiraceae bacterium]|jgi:ABC-type sugar transport system substrate-binding protein